jgi:hypothetical protein
MIELCIDAERKDCQDIAHMEVRHEKHHNYGLTAACGAGAIACAVLDWEKKVCIIHTGFRYSNETMVHERNHCRGWTHDHGDYGKPWRRM